MKESITLSPERREESVMSNQGIAHPEDLSILTKALQECCRLACIEPGTTAYEDAGRLIMVLFESGISDPDELARALRASDHRMMH